MSTVYTQVPIINAGSLYVNNLILSFVTTSSMTVSAGAARDSKNLNDIILKSTVTLKTSFVGPNGLDSGVISPTTMYAVYIVGDSTGYKETCALISLDQSQPTLPFGYDMFRRIGWISINASSEIVKFYQYGTDSTRKYYYDIADTDGSVVLSGGSAAIYTKVQLGLPGNAPLIPPFSTKVFFRNEYGQSNVANKAEFQPYGDSALAFPTATVGLGIVSLQYSCIYLITLPDETGVQSIQYRVGAGDATSLIVTGYEDYL